MFDLAKAQIFISVALGGALGALLRYMISGLAYRWAGAGFPWGTLAVNLLGAFCIGFFWVVFERFLISAQIRMFVFVGILGGLTTFSTYSIETLNLFREGEGSLAVINVLVSNACALGLAWAGMVSSRFMLNLFK